jgi:hypothetical protein
MFDNIFLMLTAQPKTKNLLPIEHEDEESKTSHTIYYMPPPTLEEKIFMPSEWKINNFQIGRHIGRGKYSLIYLDLDMSTSLEREAPSMW